MTAPTQPPDPRVERIAKALAANKLSLITSVALARVLVEELGGREATVREIETVAEPVQRVTWGYDGAITATHNGAVYVLTGPEGARFEHKNLDTLILNWPQAAPHRAALETLAAQAQPSGKAGELDTRARVLVEELGAREESYEDRKDAEADAHFCKHVIDTLREVSPEWESRFFDEKELSMGECAAEEIRTIVAQQRENAETIAALKERVSEFEYANKMLDNARKSAEQSARDLRENNATLRAELDAIKGAQPPVRWMLLRDGDFISTYDTELEAYASQQRWRNSTVHALFTHPAPALPVVGACVVKDGKLITWTSESDFPQERREVHARNYAHWHGGEPHYLHLGAPLSTEGGK